MIVRQPVYRLCRTAWVRLWHSFDRKARRAEHGSSALVIQTSIFSAMSRASSTAHGMRCIFLAVQADAVDPRGDESSILAGRQRLMRTRAWEQELPCFLPTLAQIVVERLPCDLGQFEPDRSTGLPLPHGGTVDGAAGQVVRFHS